MNPSRKARQIWRRLRLNWPLKLFSIVFAGGLWAFVNLGQRDAEQVLSVPIALTNLPSGLVVTEPVTDRVEIRIRGPRTLLGVAAEQIGAFPVDLAEIRAGRTDLDLTRERLSVPRGVRVVRVSPSEVTLTVERLTTRELPVHVDVASMPFGFRLPDKQVLPPKVKVIGPQSVLAGLEQVSTQTLTIEPVPGRFERIVALDPIGPDVAFDRDDVVVRLRVEEITEKRTFERIKVESTARDVGVEAIPAHVDVTVQGPQHLLRELSLSGIRATIDSSGSKSGPVPVVVEAPGGVEVVEIVPPTVRMTRAAR